MTLIQRSLGVENETWINVYFLTLKQLRDNNYVKWTSLDLR